MKPFAAKVTRYGRDRYQIELPEMGIGESVDFLVRSDVHWDNPHCDRRLEKRHLDQAVERGALILDFGDLFCAMQGKGDPRGSKSDIRPEHNTGQYLDSLISTATDYYEPYAEHFVLICQGNHESGVLKHRETDLTDRLAERLTERTGHRVHAGGYVNWIRILGRRSGGSRVPGFTIYATHGYGGGGPVTMDTIQTARQSDYLDGVDVVFSGHTHHAWHVERSKVSMSTRGEIYQREMDFVKLPTYKQEYLGTDGRGFHHEKGRGPKPLGAWWMRLTMRRDQQDGRDVTWIERTFTRAK